LPTSWHARRSTLTSITDRQEFIRLLGRVAELVPITYRVQACRDPKDDKFLELALNGSV
jgi:predicted nucleic acid-binding protein